MKTFAARVLAPGVALGVAVVAGLLAPGKALAGIFDLPAFVEPGGYSVGLEPEVDISNGTGAGINLKPRIGHTDFLSWEGVIGTGSGSRKFRLGITADFDWFPDVDNQPGLASPVFLNYSRFNGAGLVMFGVEPMIYKTFRGKEAEYTPFFALPLGWNFISGDVNGLVQIAIGSMFKIPKQDHWRFAAEVGFNGTHSYSYISGGVTYIH